MLRWFVRQGYLDKDDAKDRKVKGSCITASRKTSSTLVRAADPSAGNPIVDPGRQPADDPTRNGRPYKTDHRPSSGHGVAGEEVAQERQVLTDVLATADQQPDGGYQEGRSTQNADHDRHDAGAQPGDRSHNELFFSG